MPTHFVNLDALIPREYFEATEDVPTAAASLANTMRVTDLEPTHFVYPLLRKPEFQRETSNWDPQKVADLVQCFLSEELIPAIILWRSGTNTTFVIDGAHRLSALIAWVHDDYGDRQISRRFYNNQIPPEQVAAAEQTRRLIHSTVGSYEDLRKVAQNPDYSDPDRRRYARNLGMSAITLQWVAGNASTAEQSFFRINQKATLIDPTELEMIKARHEPHVLATRALIRAGTGHKYWSGFNSGTQSKIEATARSIYDTLFNPAIEPPLKTLDVPVAGRGYSPDSVKMVFELVKFVNRIGPVTERDLDGTRTLQYLQAVKRVGSLISGSEPQSLGLHPIVYFYGATGRFQASAFLAVVAFVQELERGKQLSQFTEVRARFEDFVLEYRYFANVVGRRYGSAQRGVPILIKLYNTILKGLIDGENSDGVLSRIKADSGLALLQESIEQEQSRGRNFSRGVKTAAFLKSAIDSAVRCSICGARMHFKSITTDHKVRRVEGGLGVEENAQLTHPYCNSGYKEMRVSTKRAAGR